MKFWKSVLERFFMMILFIILGGFVLFYFFLIVALILGGIGLMLEGIINIPLGIIMILTGMFLLSILCELER